MDIRVVPLSDEWATRNLQILVRSLEALPLFAKWLVDALLADSKGSVKTASGHGAGWRGSTEKR